MNSHKIALYPGDGIGIEVTNEVRRVLEAANRKFQIGLELTELDWGSRLWKRSGKIAPENFLEILQEYDAIYLGALGDPANVPDHISLVPLISTRQSFDQYVCLRPAKLYPGVKSPLADTSRGIDIMVVRENSEGEYSSVGGTLKSGTTDEVAVQSSIHTRKGIERILRYSFELAKKRKSHLTMATKSNALKFSMVLWDRIFEEIRSDYQDVESDKCHIDALCMNFVKKPSDYDVVVGSNLFGDILSDLAGAVTGSLGLAPSANINPERKYPSLFEPVHGSAPDIAGKGIANPIGAISAAAMMLDFLCEYDAAKCIENAIASCFEKDAPVTADIGGNASTSDVGNSIVDRISG